MRRKMTKRLTHEQRREIAQWIVDHPNWTVKQTARSFDVTPMVVYTVIYEFLNVSKQYAFKTTQKPADEFSTAEATHPPDNP